jgi:hypothetical protein
MASAIIAHSASGDGIWSLDPLVFLSLLFVSYVYFRKTGRVRHPDDKPHRCCLASARTPQPDAKGVGAYPDW